MPPRGRDRDAALTSLNVSRDTSDRLDRYVAMLRAWQERINLVGASTLDDLWSRHILDSAQLVFHLPADARTCADLGSGAGLPGLVLAILTDLEITLVESDRRKAAFLNAVKADLGLARVTLFADRLDRLAAPPFDVITARAFAPLHRLLDGAAAISGPGTRFVLLKGRQVEDELTDARRHWTMRVEVAPSLSSDDGRILCIEGLARARRAHEPASDEPSRR